MRRAGLLAALLAVVMPGAAPAADPGLPAIALEPAWSPSGDALAFESRPAGSARTDVSVVLVPSGTTWSVSAADPRSHHEYPAWSNDGRRLAFRSYAEAPDFAASVASRDGSGRMDVGSGGSSGPPCFTADGRVVAFDGFEEVDGARVDGRGQWTIRGGANFPVCSRRSSRVAFAALGPGTASLDVWTANPDGSGRRRLTSARGSDVPLAWSRDGKRILFSTEREAVGTRNGVTALYVMNAGGKRQHRVARAVEGDFSPTGSSVAYVTLRGGLYVVGADGRGARRVVGGTGLGSPRWSPNGRWIAFTVTANEPAGVVFRIDVVRPSGLDRHTVAPR